MWQRYIGIIWIGILIVSMFFDFSNADIYNWTDSQGVQHFSDQPPEYGATINKKTETTSERKNVFISKQPAINNMTKEEINNLYKNTFASNAALSEKTKSYLFMLMIEGGLSKEYISKINSDAEAKVLFDYIKLHRSESKVDISPIFTSANYRYSSPESTWNIYNIALKNYDINTALDCLTPKMAHNVKQILMALKKDDVIRMSNQVIMFKKMNMDSQSAVYKITRKENNKLYEYDLMFLYVFGNWKIDSPYF